ncbi:unnamed protein product [Spirodela intermedia]|uniref:Uncharacterized protein n=1 Tax=Spirodela intermedia TaxID=51605 RepID=A0A7I8IC34_SPIIN|nr:unnamed protein product [Spirodela intermedia]CAA6654924.1 unnamed protein product [Spirodela intermedia]
MPVSTRPAWVQAERTPMTVTSLGRTPRRSISRKLARALRGCPFVASPEMRTVQETTSFSGIRSNTALASAMQPHLAYMSARALPRKRVSTIFFRSTKLPIHRPRPRHRGGRRRRGR